MKKSDSSIFATQLFAKLSGEIGTTYTAARSYIVAWRMIESLYTIDTKYLNHSYHRHELMITSSGPEVLELKPNLRRGSSS